MERQLYDIRTQDNAMETLTRLTGVESDKWMFYLSWRNRYEFDEDLIEDVIKRHGFFPTSYTNWDFKFIHITTSSDECRAFLEHGIMDLQNAYLFKDSELRSFLDNNGIHIDLEKHILSYRNREYDIFYSNQAPRDGTEAYNRWRVGRKIYYDYALCGFLSICNNAPYGGMVHHQPEILLDIDNLLGTQLSQQWHLSHKAYEIVARADGSSFKYQGFDEESDRDRTLYFLTKAYYNAISEPSENVLVFRNQVQIFPDKIDCISRLNCWT